MGRVRIGGLIALATPHILTGGRLLRPFPALPGRGRLTSILVVLRPALRILIGRLLLRSVAALAGGGLACARIAGPHVLVPGLLLIGVAALAGRRRGASILVTLLPGYIRHPQCGDSLGVDSSVGLEALLTLEADQRLRCRPAQYAVGLAYPVRA